MQYTRNTCAAAAAPFRSPSLTRFLDAKFDQSVKPTTARSPVESSASKPFTKFIPGPWTAQLLMIANPGMPAREALRLTEAIHRSHEGATCTQKAAAARSDKKSTAVVAGACA